MKPYRLLAIGALLGIPVPAGAQEAQGYVPAAAGSFPTLARAIEVAAGKVMVGATVSQADVPATNGVIHAIDTVLLPE